MRARDNPFAVDRVLAVRYKPQGCTWDDLLTRLESLRYCASIVGPQGTGKTTLLEDLAPRLQSRGFEPIFLRLDSTDSRLNRNQWRQAASAGKRHILLLDGAEQLPTSHWLWFRYQARGAGGAVVTSHRAGRLPVLVRTTTSASLLSEILTELGVRRADADLLLDRHQGNIREVIRGLYDLCCSGS